MIAPTYENLSKGLMGLVKQLGRDDLATIEALLNDVIGNRVAALMFRQLMRWWPKSQDGWVYKSHQDWWAELRIKQSELPKANGALERVGVTTALHKANGAPTKHYRLDIKQFLKVLASTLKLSAKKLAALLQNAFRDSGKMDLANGSKSITTEPSTRPPTDSNAVLLDTSIEEAKSIKGVSDHTARLLVGKYGPENVTRAVKLIRSRPFDNPAGALVIALREQWEFSGVEAKYTNPQAEAADGDKFAEDGTQAEDYSAPPGWPPISVPFPDDAPIHESSQDDDETEPDEKPINPQEDDQANSKPQNHPLWEQWVLEHATQNGALPLNRWLEAMGEGAR